MASNQQLSREVVRLQNENASLQMQVEKLQGALLKAAGDPTHARAAEAAHNSEQTSARLQSEYEQLYAKHEYAQKLYSKLLDDYEYLKTRNANVQTLNEQLSSENEELRLDNIRLRQVQDKLASDYEFAYNMVTELRDAHAKAKDDTEVLLAEVERLTAMINDSRFKDGYRLMEEIKLLREQLGSARQRKTTASLKKANRVLQHEIEDIQKDVSHLHKAIIEGETGPTSGTGASQEARLAEIRNRQARVAHQWKQRQNQTTVGDENHRRIGNVNPTREGLANLSHQLDAIDHSLRTRSASSEPRRRQYAQRGRSPVTKSSPLQHRTYTAPDWPQGPSQRQTQAPSPASGVAASSFKRSQPGARPVARRQTTASVVSQARVDRRQVEFKEIPRDRYVDSTYVSQSIQVPAGQTWQTMVANHDTGGGWSISQPGDTRSRTKMLRSRRARSVSPQRLAKQHRSSLLDREGEDLHSPSEKPYEYKGASGGPDRHCDVCAVLLSAGVSTTYCHRHAKNRETQYQIPPNYKPNMAYSDPIDLAANLAFISGKQLKKGKKERPSWR